MILWAGSASGADGRYIVGGRGRVPTRVVGTYSIDKEAATCMDGPRRFSRPNSGETLKGRSGPTSAPTERYVHEESSTLSDST